MKQNLLRKNYRLDLAADEVELAEALKELLDKGRGHITDAASGRS